MSWGGGESSLGTISMWYPKMQCYSSAERLIQI